jgi:hypothetical protein
MLNKKHMYKFKKENETQNIESIKKKTNIIRRRVETTIFS